MKVEQTNLFYNLTFISDIFSPETPRPILQTVSSLGPCVVRLPGGKLCRWGNYSGRIHIQPRILLNLPYITFLKNLMINLGRCPKRRGEGGPAISELFSKISDEQKLVVTISSHDKQATKGCQNHQSQKQSADSEM